MKFSEKARSIEPSSTLAITAKAKKMKSEGIDVIGFGAGEPDFDTPINIKNAAIKAINEGFTKYTPASGILKLKEEICNKFKEDNNLDYEPNQIIISNGAKHSLTNAFMAILSPGDEVIIPAPFWLSYPQMVKIADGVPVVVKTQKENRFKLTPEELKSSITDKTKAIIINSPSNPSGMVYTKEELSALADIIIENDLYVISDEIYEKIIYGDTKHVSIASLSPEMYERTIVINGVSKSYAMTGWRIGYIGANKEIVKIMSNMQSHMSSNPNSIAQVATIEALSGEQTCVKDMKDEFEKRKKYMVERINNMDSISMLEPDGAFYGFVDISKLINKKYKENIIRDASDFAKYILEYEKVALIPCTDFGFKDYIRLSYAISLDDIKKGLDRIESFIKLIKE